MREQLEAEKKRMCPSDQSLDVVVDVNVGGQKFTTLRQTLCSIPGSFLEAIFSGRHRTLVHNGAIFIDRNPRYFEMILDWLRSPTAARVASLPLTDTLFHEELEYYGLSEAVRQRNMRSAVCVVGGQNASHERLSTTEILDLETHQWSTCAAMGQSRVFTGSCVLDGLFSYSYRVLTLQAACS